MRPTPWITFAIGNVDRFDAVAGIELAGAKGSQLSLVQSTLVIQRVIRACSGALGVMGTMMLTNQRS